MSLCGDMGSLDGGAWKKAASSRAMSWLPCDEIQGRRGGQGHFFRGQPGGDVQQGSGHFSAAQFLCC